MTFIQNYIKNEDGLVTLEWVGIAAVVVIAGILISTFVMQGADNAGGSVQGAANSVATAADSQVPGTLLDTIGDGTSG